MSGRRGGEDPVMQIRFSFRPDEGPRAGEEPGRGRGSREAADLDQGFEPAHGGFGETPLTDPRSLASSALVHLLLVAVASLTVLQATRPREAERPATLRGEIGPADTRADRRDAAGSGGGSEGEIGGLGTVEFRAPSSGTDPRGAGPDPAADAILNEILPDRSPRDLERALPGPQTTGIGLIPGSGSGGGGGSGGGSGGGEGREVGPGTEFFGARDNAHSFVYVIDCSGSMVAQDSLGVAKRELMNSLNPLPPDARFAAIFYNLKVRILADPSGQQGMMPATAANKARVEAQLRSVGPDGGTDHMLALRTALGLKPEVVFFLTDADMMSNSEVDKILPLAAGVRIQAVEFGRGSDLGTGTPLRRLATTTGGTYRYIDVMNFPKSARGL
ncbi:vWA domain-containing protein [Aquisphaera insulae]|uniref:vWA domain-containing protein n=1 Tax=Aquisphaera insulae TaxID=2712864 RepID=UPI00202E9D76|nr:hypothetical protein [Aquisphaera insulae]